MTERISPADEMDELKSKFKLQLVKAGSVLVGNQELAYSLPFPNASHFISVYYWYDM